MVTMEQFTSLHMQVCWHVKNMMNGTMFLKGNVPIWKSTILITQRNSSSSSLLNVTSFVEGHDTHRLAGVQSGM